MILAGPPDVTLTVESDLFYLVSRPPRATVYLIASWAESSYAGAALDRKYMIGTWDGADLDVWPGHASGPAGAGTTRLHI